MAKTKKSNKRLFEIVLIAFVVIGIILILAEMATNLAAEISSQDDLVSSHQEATPTPRPTLSPEELEELYSAPVGEEGD
jgi:hypothetical protein